MKIQVDGQTIYELSETKKNVIKNEISEAIFVSDMKRRARWAVEHKYEMCFEKLKKEWEHRLRERVQSVPTDPDKLAELIFSQPDYRSRYQLDEEEKVRQHKERTNQL